MADHISTCPIHPSLGDFSEGSHSSQERLFVVEDDPLTSQDLKERLESLNYRVVGVTHHATEALELVQTLKPDLVLMDVHLPGEMDGIQAAHQLRAAEIPFMFVTGFSGGSVLERAKATEPYGYILKPYMLADLKIAIEIGLFKYRADKERRRLAGTLQAGPAGLQTLKGLLSICSYCKKIKESSENWTQIESYIMKRSAATFSHGMCPECFAQVLRQLAAVQENDLASGSVILG